MKMWLLGIVGLAVFTASSGAEEVADLVRKLKDKDQEVRRAAARALAESGAAAKPAIPELIAALKDSDLYVRRFACQAFAAMGPEAKEAIPALSKALDDDKKQVRGAALIALTKMGEAGRPALSKALTNPNPDVQEAAIAAVGETGKEGDGPLGELAKDARFDVDIRRQAIDVLKNLGKESRPAVPALIEVIKATKAKGDVTRLRDDAIKTLEVVSDKSDKSVLDALIELAADVKTTPGLRNEDIRGLGLLATREDTKVIEGLRKLAKEETKSVQVKNFAKDTLAKLEGK